MIDSPKCQICSATNITEATELSGIGTKIPLISMIFANKTRLMILRSSKLTSNRS